VDSSTVFGRIAVVLFYSYIWLGILSITVLFFLPTSQGFACAVDNFDDYTQAYIKTMTRILCPHLVVLYLYFEWHGAHSLCNVTVLAVINTIVMLGTAATKGTPDEQNRISEECFGYLVNSFSINLVWTWLVVLLVLMDWFRTRPRLGTAAEIQPLA
jgi:hypothetical protein